MLHSRQVVGELLAMSSSWQASASGPWAVQPAVLTLDVSLG